MRLRLVPDDLNLDFFKYATITYGVSLLLVVASVVLFFVQGLNYGIDFRGGTVMTVETPEKPDIGALRSVLGGLDLGDVAVTAVSDPGGTVRNAAMIRIQQQDEDPDIQAQHVATARAALDASFPGIDYLQVDSVGAKVSSELVRQGVLAVVLSVAAVAFYVWLRFEWQFALGAVAALIHDVALTLGVFVLTGIQFNLSIIAAILTIVGYSLNDTVVVFDRVREVLRKYKTKPLLEVLNIAINETMSRTIMTSLTTLLALFALYFLGGEVIRGFVFAMIFGVFVGTYSTIFVATVILWKLGVKRDWDKTDAAAGTQFSNIDA